MDVGHSTGPMVVGVLVGVWGYRLGFGAVTLLLGVAAALFALLMPGAGAREVAS